MSNSPIFERIMSFIADGVGQFEGPVNINHCQKCPLSQGRNRVVVAQTIIPKRFFILVEFPQIEDEASEEVFSTKSSAGIILNLIDKLGIRENCHFSFALKCVSPKQLPEDNLSTCVHENLRRELKMVSPEIVFCFGTRTFLALQQLSLSAEIYLLPTASELKENPHWRLPVWSKLAHFKQKTPVDS